jgi:hypothetical protein
MNNNIGELIYNYLLFDDQIKFAEYLNDTYLMKKAFQNKYDDSFYKYNNSFYIEKNNLTDKRCLTNMFGCRKCDLIQSKNKLKAYFICTNCFDMNRYCDNCTISDQINCHKCNIINLAHLNNLTIKHYMEY